MTTYIDPLAGFRQDVREMEREKKGAVNEGAVKEGGICMVVGEWRYLCLCRRRL